MAHPRTLPAALPASVAHLDPSLLPFFFSFLLSLFLPFLSPYTYIPLLPIPTPQLRAALPLPLPSCPSSIFFPSFYLSLLPTSNPLCFPFSSPSSFPSRRLTYLCCPFRLFPALLPSLFPSLALPCMYSLCLLYPALLSLSPFVAILTSAAHLDPSLASCSSSSYSSSPLDSSLYSLSLLCPALLPFSFLFALSTSAAHVDPSPASCLPLSLPLPLPLPSLCSLCLRVRQPGEAGAIQHLGDGKVRKKRMGEISFKFRSFSK